MTNEEAKILLDKYNQGLASPAEVALLQYWFIHEASRAEAAMSDNELQQIVADMRKEVIAQTKPNRSLWPQIARIGIAWKVAAAVAAIVFGVWFYHAHYTNGRHPELVSGSQFKNDIAPGKNTATITLPNGKTITLSDAKTGVIIDATKLSYNDGSAVDQQLSPSGGDAAGRGGRNTNNPLSPQGGSLPEGERSSMMLTASTPRGGTYQFTLPDGTQVWLNAASKISFPSQFSGTNRKILLSGEAYFEVAKVTQLSPSGRDGRRPERVPFIVESKGQEVTVLGTHFNINAYPDENSTKTTLLEGSVKVSTMLLSPSGGDAAGRGGSITLSPNQQATNTGSTIKVTTVDPDDAISWKTGEFKFSSEALSTIMRKVSRWYDVEVVYKDDIGNIKLTGSISRFENVSKLLAMLQNTKEVHFEIEGKRIIVSK